MAAPPSLRLLPGGRSTTWQSGDLELVAASPQEAPFSIEWRVVEEDRWRVVGASPEWSPPSPEHPLRLHTALVFEQPAALGSIECHGRCWHAVVVDVDAERLVEPASVAAALAAVAALCERHAVSRLGVPLLGAVHGDLDPQRALAVLREELLDRPPAALRRIWLQIPLRHRTVVEQALARWSAEGE